MLPRPNLSKSAQAVGAGSCHFRYPLIPCPRVAVFSRLHVSATSQVQVFAPGTLVDLVKLRFETAAGSPSQLLSLCQTNWEPLMPLAAFTSEDLGFLDAEKRWQLWNRFEIPVYEQWIDYLGEVIAEECDAHDGLHLRGTIPTDLLRQEGLCACGKTGDRVRTPYYPQTFSFATAS